MTGTDRSESSGFRYNSSPLVNSDSTKYGSPNYDGQIDLKMHTLKDDFGVDFPLLKLRPEYLNEDLFCQNKILKTALKKTFKALGDYFKGDSNFQVPKLNEILDINITDHNVCYKLQQPQTHKTNDEINLPVITTIDNFQCFEKLITSAFGNFNNESFFEFIGQMENLINILLATLQNTMPLNVISNIMEGYFKQTSDAKIIEMENTIANLQSSKAKWENMFLTLQSKLESKAEGQPRLNKLDRTIKSDSKASGDEEPSLLQPNTNEVSNNETNKSLTQIELEFAACQVQNSRLKCMIEDRDLTIRKLIEQRNRELNFGMKEALNELWSNDLCQPFLGLINQMKRSMDITSTKFKIRSNYWRTKYKIVRKEVDVLKGQNENLPPDTPDKVIIHLQAENSDLRTQMLESKLLFRTLVDEKTSLTANLVEYYPKTLEALKDKLSLIFEALFNPNLTCSALLVREIGLKKQIDCLLKFKNNLEHRLKISKCYGSPEVSKDKLELLEQLCQTKEVELERMRKIAKISETLTLLPLNQQIAGIDSQQSKLPNVSDIGVLNSVNDIVVEDLKTLLVEKMRDFSQQRQQLIDLHRNNEIALNEEIFALKRDLEGTHQTETELLMCKDKLNQLYVESDKIRVENKMLCQRLLDSDKDKDLKVMELNHILEGQEQILLQTRKFEASKLEEENLKLNRRIQNLDRALCNSQAKIIRMRINQNKITKELALFKSKIISKDSTIVKLNAIIARYRLTLSNNRKRKMINYTQNTHETYNESHDVDNVDRYIIKDYQDATKNGIFDLDSSFPFNHTYSATSKASLDCNIDKEEFTRLLPDDVRVLKCMIFKLKRYLNALSKIVLNKNESKSRLLNNGLTNPRNLVSICVGTQTLINPDFTTENTESNKRCRSLSNLDRQEKRQNSLKVMEDLIRNLKSQCRVQEKEIEELKKQIQINRTSSDNYNSSIHQSGIVNLGKRNLAIDIIDNNRNKGNVCKVLIKEEKEITAQTNYENIIKNLETSLKEKSELLNRAHGALKEAIIREGNLQMEYLKHL